MQAETEPSLSWHTALYFANPAPAWRVLYRSEGAPALMERTFGRGSLVIAADSYFLSNEAMRAERAPRLIAWMLDSRSRVLFDETHLGVAEKPGIAALIGKYNLEGLLAAICVLAALFVWHASSPFLPPKPDSDDPGIIAGKDSTAGFVSLLRRGIAPSRLIDVCLDHWKKSVVAIRPGKWTLALAQIDAAAAQGSREPLATYRAISQIVAEKK